MGHPATISLWGASINCRELTVTTVSLLPHSPNTSHPTKAPGDRTGPPTSLRPKEFPRSDAEHPPPPPRSQRPRLVAGDRHRLSPPTPRIRAAPDPAGPRDVGFPMRPAGQCLRRRQRRRRRGRRLRREAAGQARTPRTRSWPSVGLLRRRRSQPPLAVRARKSPPSRAARPAARTGTRTADRKVPLRADPRPALPRAVCRPPGNRVIYHRVNAAHSSRSRVCLEQLQSSTTKNLKFFSAKIESRTHKHCECVYRPCYIWRIL
ncbi:serine/arginine repetitive matrix protein 1-like [Ochotona princeps]|uniref:serine/arginine repetitive matrix protein 1-like n=1 Tax=Ochotona princeps TaxID=9978 RepID=UPI002714F0FA|nr:serine/arginine repetitive matrix protein 1-like [Ochotona princeps]